ncbi:MAG: chromate transporter [Xanthobacteraceae bacterium]
MKIDLGTLFSIAIHFGLLSLFAVGGGNSVIPEIHRHAVEVAHWMSDRQFADIFAISQAAPGPNFLITTLIGYHVAGLPGAVVATVAMCGPSSVLAYYVSGTWERFKYARWRIATQNGLIPVSVGLIGATGIIVTQAADHTVLAYAVTAVTAAVTYYTRLSPVWLFAAAGLLGLGGLV